MTIGTFACIIAMRRKGRSVEGIADLAGLSRTDPVLAVWLAVFMFSMAGIPPFGGFFGKFFIFTAAVEQGMWTLAVIGVLTSVVGAFYYIRIIKVMFFDAPAEAFDARPGSISFVSLRAACLRRCSSSTPLRWLPPPRRLRKSCSTDTRARKRAASFA